MVHIDGKAIKGTIQNADNKKQSFVMLVSAYSSKLRQTLAVEAIDSQKESEIAAAKRLIAKIQGAIVTADALHTTAETMQALKEKGNDYILQVKKNRPALYKEAALIAKEGQEESKHISIEKNRGRLEVREVRVYEASTQLRSRIERVVEVQRNGKSHYYVTSMRKDAKFIGEVIRKHWSVETMHYIKDVVMLEDDGKSKNKQLATILSILRAYCLNLISKVGFKSPTSFIRLYSHHIPLLLNFL